MDRMAMDEQHIPKLGNQRKRLEVKKENKVLSSQIEIEDCRRINGEGEKLGEIHKTQAQAREEDVTTKQDLAKLKNTIITFKFTISRLLL